MKKKILSIVVAGALTITSVTPVFATPNQEVIENQQKYDDISKKIEDIQGKIYSLNEQIAPLAEKVDNNKKQMDSIKDEVENTKKEIETSKVDISEKEEVLGKRLRELYKSGGQGSYLTLLFSADSFSDLISKLDSATRLVNIDKKIVKDLVDKKEKLDEKVTSLEEKRNEIAKINEEVKKDLDEFTGKKQEQEALIAEIEAERAKFDKEFLSVAERSLVEPQLAILESSSSITDLQSAISQLRSIRDNQLKSPTVVEEINNSIEAAKVKLEELQAQEEAANKPSIPNRGPGSSASGNAIVDFAYGYIGAPYVYGATGPSSFDCSGFTSFVFRNAAGIDITRTTYTQIGVGTPVSYGELQPGDLVFTYGLDHVGIYVGGGQYIHAPQPGDSVKVSPVTSFYAARRVL
ncbi:NlpC/P60 family protein [Clostridium tertium]|jgi:peptidoglycan DL-endopeptidase CwlO|uniref:C40 family peptidase n=1 Tax=Clostridium tertium TaxID=1559 RepID=UPI000BE2DBAC|nr:C40 family peptidase [Clostridium tertium]MBU6136801.1 C40 family peptidase [Clostridium tertium]MDB1970984.1 NlpC/P60 family protein [Clostridium tertium]MDI9217842.1 NlpC/P60 family protein [Clostridium tertium]MDY4606589.1 NlpC/P60 family protein [Clostridium tertium]